MSLHHCPNHHILRLYEGFASILYLEFEYINSLVVSVNHYMITYKRRYNLNWLLINSEHLACVQNKILKNGPQWLKNAWLVCAPLGIHLEPENYMHHERMNCSAPDKIICHTIGPKSFLFATAQFSLWASGTVNCD